MNYKLLIYIFSILLSVYALSGINYEKFIKRNKIIETRFLVLILSLISGYLLTNFIVDFLEISKII